MRDREWLDRVVAAAERPASASVGAALGDLVLDTIAIGAGARLRRAGATASDAAALAPLPPGPARVWGLPVETGAPQAAFLNGTAAEVLDFQEVLIDGRNNGHAAVVIVPALLALAEARGAFGRRLLAGLDAAFTANLMLMRALGRGHREGAPGFRTTSLGAPIAAALGGGVLLGLPPDRIAHAVAIAASALPAGLLAAMAPEQGSYSSDKDLAVGWAARHGLEAVLLAEAGATGPADPLTGRRGWLASYGFGTEDPEAFEAAVPADAALAYAIKRYPTNFGAQAAARAAIDLREAAGGKAIEAVEIRVKTSSAASLSTRAIVNHLAARFSLPYVVASCLVRGRCRLEDFDEAAISDEAVLAVMGRSEIVADEAMERAHRSRGIFPAEVRVTFADSRTAAARAYEGPWDGLDAEARRAALREKVEALLGERAARLIDATRDVGRADGAALSAAIGGLAG